MYPQISIMPSREKDVDYNVFFSQLGAGLEDIRIIVEVANPQNSQAFLPQALAVRQGLRKLSSPYANRAL